ncbi:MAG: ATPase, T2SS/T4P/T4SS family [Vicinamibacterales bacterium]
MRTSLVPSLLQAIVVMDGEGAVMHVGERPYVVTERGQVSLARSPLSAMVMAEVIDEVLTDAARRSLDQTGAATIALPEFTHLPGERFTAVVARGGDGAWVEIRRTTPFDAARTDVSQRSRLGSTDAPLRGRRRTDREPGTVVPLARPASRAQTLGSSSSRDVPELERLVRLAAARGATSLYLVSGAAPAVRVDGQIAMLDTTPLDPADIDAMLLGAPRNLHRADRPGDDVGWEMDVAALGRVRCLPFNDRRGPGAVLHITPLRAPTPEQLGLTRDLLDRLALTDGLIIVAGPRDSGTRELIAGVIGHAARTRRSHVVVIERDFAAAQPVATHVSQRAVCSTEEAEIALQHALREDPDILVVDDVRSARLLELLIEAAVPGRLVVGSVPARTATGALDALIGLTTPASRLRTQRALAATLTSVVAQVLVKQKSGGRVAARELLVNTPAVTALIADGATALLPAAIEGGRAAGMISLNDSIAALVTSGAVDAADACRVAPDRSTLLQLLQRHGVDVSSLQRLG